MNELPCGRTECVFKAIEEMIAKMREDIAKKQNIAYTEQIVVAEIYNVTASTLAEACRKKFDVEPSNCIDKEHKSQVSMDTFILLKTIKDDGLISEEYKNDLFDMLLKMGPELEERVKKDKESGIL